VTDELRLRLRMEDVPESWCLDNGVAVLTHHDHGHWSYEAYEELDDVFAPQDVIDREFQGCKPQPR
jgi:hypothetical protein